MTRGWSKRGGVPAVALLVVVASSAAARMRSSPTRWRPRRRRRATLRTGERSATPRCGSGTRANPRSTGRRRARRRWRPRSRSSARRCCSRSSRSCGPRARRRCRTRSTPSMPSSRTPTVDSRRSSPATEARPATRSPGRRGGCGWSEVAVTAVDYGYEGVPETIEAGTAIFTMTNEGDEGHEMILFRRNDGVEESFEELLEMDDAMEFVEFTAAAFAPAGETSSAAADLRAGDYVMVCFIPVGSDAFADRPAMAHPTSRKGCGPASRSRDARPAHAPAARTWRARRHRSVHARWHEGSRASPADSTDSGIRSLVALPGQESCRVDNAPPMRSWPQHSRTCSSVTIGRWSVAGRVHEMNAPSRAVLDRHGFRVAPDPDVEGHLLTVRVIT
jgi:hypothetical protein